MIRKLILLEVGGSRERLLLDKKFFLYVKYLGNWYVLFVVTILVIRNLLMKAYLDCNLKLGGGFLSGD